MLSTGDDSAVFEEQVAHCRTPILFVALSGECLSYSKMPDWSVQIVGDTFDLEDLVDWFNSPGLSVVQRANEFYVRSTRFDAAKDANEVRSLANDLAEKLIGAARLFRPDFGPIRLGTVVKEDEPGARELYLSVSQPIVTRSKARGKLTVTRAGKDPNTPAPVIWLNVALTDEKVAHALRLWGRDRHDWVNLYKVLEIVESDVGGEIYERGWVGEPEVRRFTQTANSAEALGDAARHAKKHVPAPRRPMTIEEAEHLIAGLLKKWIESKKESQ